MFFATYRTPGENIGFGELPADDSTLFDLLQQYNSTVDVLSLQSGSASDDRFATMFWSYFDSETRILHYVNAGHCPPLLFGVRDGQLEVKRLNAGGPVLGVLDDAAYVQGHAKTNASDLTSCTRTALLKHKAPPEKSLATRLIALLNDAVHQSPEKILASVLVRVRRFLGNTSAQDDLTCVVARLGTTVTKTRDLSKTAAVASHTAGTTASTDALRTFADRS
jgi:hypothetical protein